MSHPSGAGQNGPGRRFRLLWIAGLALGVIGGALVAVTLTGVEPAVQAVAN
jgi:hypothetical protein